MSSLRPEQHNYSRATRVTSAVMLALFASTFVFSITQCALSTPQEQAADSGQSVGILICAVIALLGVTCINLVFPAVAARLEEQSRFSTARFLGHVLARLVIVALVGSIALHILFGGSFASSSSFAELLRLLVLVSALLAASVSPFALLWRWLAK